jgi:hypothetical protein
MEITCPGPLPDGDPDPAPCPVAARAQLGIAMRSGWRKVGEVWCCGACYERRVETLAEAEARAKLQPPF